MGREGRPKIWAARVGNIRGLPGIKRIGIIPNSRVRIIMWHEKRVDEGIDEYSPAVGHNDRMKNERIFKSANDRKCFK